MRRMSCFPLIIILMAGCHGPANNTGSKDAGTDTVVEKVLLPNRGDTMAIDRKIGKDSDEGEGPEENLDTILQRTIAEYGRTYVVDTVFNIHGNSFQLHLKHYCLMDSGIKVPKTYTDIYKLDSFVTHNYVTQIKLDKNGKTLLDRKVYKQDFDSLLYPQLKTYGALLFPSVRLQDDTIMVHYSISIPLTDVGVGLTMAINDHGVVSFNDRSY